MNAFKIVECSETNTYMVGLEDYIYNIIGGKFYASGSYNVFASRILGFTYPDYLRYVRDNYNAVLKGREGYSYAIYKNRNDCYDIVKVLNKAWSKVEGIISNRLKEE